MVTVIMAMSEQDKRPYGKSAPWPEGTNLNDAEGILAFQEKLAQLILTGEISDRKGGALNNLLAIRLRYYLDAHRVKQLEDQVKQIIALLPPEIKAKVEADVKNET
jgi:hypothetical protein